MIKPLVAGNWKMNGLRSALAEVEIMSNALQQAAPVCDVLLCPPATLLPVLAANLKNLHLGLGGQDCHTADKGAHTGDISADMLRDAGAGWVIVGHSERRSDHGETSAVVCAKATAAHRAGLTAIICIGETAGERRAGLTIEVVERQIINSLPDSSTAANVVVAYEPVWAIGTGLTPQPTDIADVHAYIRKVLGARFTDAGEFRLLYGGSVKAANAADLMAVENVNGALVGGASLTAQEFLGIITCYSDRQRWVGMN